ncbi:hypothetical protein B0H63DRAFT_503961 [Podospora didyma]|uniref:Nucleoside phosphorylase domain-containing protein n=1 Tax=Podospora didyma TaxID=330526 RepID=A0AAE0N4D2_9PEZI|nr:hypothetical protein B0H63DRAFT_503961 [Podospora didyma]
MCAVAASFDERWDIKPYGKARQDSNKYSAGSIGHHNVVLVHMPNMGKVAAATAAANLRFSFPGIKLALMVGICGATPFASMSSKMPGGEILLGDVVISEGLVQYDLGRRLPNNRFMRKDTPSDNLPRPSSDIRSILALLRTEQITGLKADEIRTLSKLKKSPYEDMKDRNPDRIQEWQESRSKALWVSADPRCGKSVLAKYLVDSFLPSTEQRTTCYFFFKDDFEDQRSITTALCCILHQLFRQRPDLLPEAILGQLEADREKFTNSFSEMWSTLLSISEDDDASEIVCSSQIAQTLCKLYRSDRSSNLKLLLTSRPFSKIRQGFQLPDIPELAVVHLSGENETEMGNITKEIDIFIKARVQDMKLLLCCLLKFPHRTYLWVHLTLELVEHDDDIDKPGIVKATSHLPRTVDEAYDGILSETRDPKEAKRILHIVVAAARPLTLKEMGFALAIRGHHISYRDVELKPQDRLRENIRNTCSLFITIIDSKIYLLHQTAKEFLVDSRLAESSSHIPRKLEWKHSLKKQVSHRVIAEICVWHLLFDEYDFLGMPPPLSPYVDDHVFLAYSACHWAVHLREADVKFVNAVAQSALQICNANSSRFPTWFRVYWESAHTARSEEAPDFTSLMAAPYFGLRAVVKLLLKNGRSQVNARDPTYGRTALSWAAGAGFNNKYGRTPLAYAVWTGNLATMKLILKSGARADLEDEIGGTPFSYAVCNGQNDVLQLLLKRASQTDSLDQTPKDLLLSAAKRGHEAVVKLLLDKGIAADLRDGDGHHQDKSPLHCAIESDHRTITNILLNNGADVESKDSERGRETIIMLLLKKGVNIESKDNDGRTPLIRAAQSREGLVVRVLLYKGADIESKDNDGCTPLIWAARYRDELIIELLLKKGANIESKDINGRTPLMWAAECDDPDWAGLRASGMNVGATCIVTLGQASPQTRDEDPDRHAEEGSEVDMRYLLQKGAHIGAMDNEGRTPEWWARHGGHQAVVNLLVLNGAN